MRQKIQRILERLTAGAYERDEAIALGLLGALAGESIFLLGLPGVGKSMIARRLKLAFKDAKVFEYLMSRFSTPDEIFGPVSISKLKNEDSYERVTSGYLPDAEVVFLDEIWKAGPAIQNSLLTVLNEKIYLNGNNEFHLPTKAIIAASNELPAEGEGLEALWDRFLIRYIVEPIQRKDNFFKLLENRKTSESNREIEVLTDADYKKVISESRNVELPKNIMEILYTLRCKMEKISQSKDDEDDAQTMLYVSDRRWKKCVGIMKTSAYLNGRNSVDMSDLILLDHLLWNSDAEIATLRILLVETIVLALFSQVLSEYKEIKSMAKLNVASDNPYTQDNRHYIIQCDDFSLRIKIEDYNYLKANPRKILFGSETTDGCIVLKDRGQYSILYSKPGYLCLNSYNYPLVMNGASYRQQTFFRTVGATIERITGGFKDEIATNMFVKTAAIKKDLDKAIADFAKRYAQPEQR